MLTDLGLMEVHVGALFTHDAGSRMLSVNEPDGAVASAPRLFLGRTRAGNVWRFRADLPENLARELDSLCADEPPLTAEFGGPPRHARTYVRLLEEHAPVERMSAGPAYHFPENVAPSRRAVALTEKDAESLRGGFEELVAELPAWQPFVALVEDGRAVSVCRSVRITPEAHEAGVETLPDFRGRGYAKDVAAEWARRVRTIGAVPLYSTSWENHASQAVARKLRLECYGADFHVA
ncbi:MAG TPA: GNAT family N-acetyltransferase [Pyrinomonadaceae bacterium]|jgi:RimJ/RimL family protein N-acetyltransferase|nr:GNAT family N-acetyltransferase [Pyrinomonadaceae bacterium]